MQVPLELSFRNMETSPELEELIQEHVDKLEEFFDRITACRVVVEAPHQHHHKGNLYQVRIYLSVPEHDIVVDRSPEKDRAHEDIQIAIRDAFDAARRQLQDFVRKLRHEVKEHATPAHGRIKEFFPSSIDIAEGYGFIEAVDGREIYFDAHSLLDAGLKDLTVGTEVRFVEEEGEKGPQASSVSLVGRHHHLSE
ncbi:MAG: HPF/RaiA family ribosome-associated protein [Planctomycetaceae bacterium]|nr:HPF/RaiA family ribosome-associated protein [Planctomycetaceae bacterium]